MARGIDLRAVESQKGASLFERSCPQIADEFGVNTPFTSDPAASYI